MQLGPPGDDVNTARACLLNTYSAVVGAGGITFVVMGAEAMIVNAENNSNVPEGGKKRRLWKLC
jgi:hypothetical protein